MNPVFLSALLALRPAARDGRGAGEPPRPCAPPGTGGDQVLSLTRARAAICRAGIGEAELRVACAALKAHGDWMDHQRAELIEALLDDPATAPAFDPAPGIYDIATRLDWPDVLGGLAVFALLVMGLWVAFGGGLPTGGSELMGGVR